MLVLFLGVSLVIIEERKHIFYLNIKYESSLFFSDIEVMLAFLFAYTYHTLGPPYLIKVPKGLCSGLKSYLKCSHNDWIWYPHAFMFLHMRFKNEDSFVFFEI